MSNPARATTLAKNVKKNQRLEYHLILLKLSPSWSKNTNNGHFLWVGTLTLLIMVLSRVQIILFITIVEHVFVLWICYSMVLLCGSFLQCFCKFFIVVHFPKPVLHLDNKLYSYVY